MKKKQVMLIVLAVLSLATLQAQSKVQQQIGLSLGYNNGLFKDLNFSTLNYQESSGATVLTYTRTKNNNIFRAQIDASLGSLNTKVSDLFTTDAYVGNVRLEYLKRVAKPSDKLSIHLGGQFNANANIYNYRDLNSFTFSLAHSLGLSTLATYQLNTRSRFQTSLSIPLMTLLVRPPYAGDDTELTENVDKPLKLITNGEVTSVNKFIAVDWSLAYIHQLSPRLDLNLNYRLQYQHIFDLHAYTHMQSHYMVGLAIKF